MDIVMETAYKYNSLSDSTKLFLRTKLKRVKNGPKERLTIKDHEDIEFDVDELRDIDNEEKFNAFLDSKMNKIKNNELLNKPIENVTITQNNNPLNNVEIVEKEMPIEQSDMLVGTGLTGVISDKPLSDESINYEVVNTPSENKEEIKQAKPMVNEAPILMPNKYAKKYTLSNKKESGVADAIVISVIVLVYVAIIVNLIIRLK